MSKIETAFGSIELKNINLKESTFTISGRYIDEKNKEKYTAVIVVVINYEYKTFKVLTDNFKQEFVFEGSFVCLCKFNAIVNAYRNALVFIESELRK